MLIIGGGLAGLTAALDLANRGKQVLVFEKNSYPNHKVCGEYVSNEVLPYLESLGTHLQQFQLPKIDSLRISTQKGKTMEVKLPLGGFGISRYTFDNLLYQAALQKGVDFIFDSVQEVQFLDDTFYVTVSTKEKYFSKVVLGAFGKRANLDMKMQREFIQAKSPWLGLKCHYEYKGLPSNVVELHNFPGGYGGLSQIEGGTVNFCCLVQYESFRQAGNIDIFLEKTASQNPFLQDFFSKATPKFNTPLSIAQISFEPKKTIDQHILMCGDAAGLIHPLCGNGMAMAIHSAKLATEQVDMFLENPNFTRKDLEKNYQLLWEKNFRRRLWTGRQLQKLMMHTKWFNLGMGLTTNSKTLLQGLIRSTHGKPILN